MSTTRTRVALGGFGGWGQMHARAIAAIEDAEVVAVYCHGEASRNAAAAQLPDVPRFADYGAMLAAGGFDVVSVTVPNHVHAAFAVAALEAGAHVFLEKPLGLTLAECDQVIAAARRTGRRVTLDHELRVSRQWGAIRDIVAAGDVGRVRYQHFSLFRHPFRPGSGGWRHDPARVGSWILEELVHFYDLVLWYAAENGPPARVRAFGEPAVAGLVANFSTLLEWHDGSTALLTQTLAGFEHHTMHEIAGTDGAIRTWWSGAVARTTTPEFSLKVRRRGSAEAETVAVPLSGEVFELEENLRRAFAAFRSGRSPLPPEEARASIAICLAAGEAHASSRAVDLSW
ncbi:MAG: Gfo/Idh/MocA family oxidoreductase [Alphaproteobacteria bacterium]|nr:Gfo/Idh/MocA family oxidoreductase [Alphaproteobacteria bacterium]